MEDHGSRLMRLPRLVLMFRATVIFMPLNMLYPSWDHRVMHGQLTLANKRANECTAY